MGWAGWGEGNRVEDMGQGVTTLEYTFFGEF